MRTLKNRIVSIVCFFSIMCGELFAQTVDFPYIESFEGDMTNSGWMLNPGHSMTVNALKNKWCVSSVESYLGGKSLVVSNNGNNAVYENRTGFPVVYKEFVLPAGDYDLSFAWRAQGEGSVDGLYVCWQSALGGVKTESSVAGLPSWVKSSALTFQGKQMLNGVAAWKTETTTIKSTGDPMRLVFVWENNGYLAYAPSACVDFIQIVPKGKCANPENFTVDINKKDMVASLSWTGTSVSYEVMYRKFGTSDVNVVKSIKGTTTVIKNLVEGVYDFWVRGVCGADTSMWVAKNMVLVELGSTRCIDFANFKAKGTECSVGTFSDPHRTSTPGGVDFGPNAIESRHTMHWYPGEVDPRTGGKLKTVPEGEVYSVRLGNWREGAEAESVVYTYTVPADVSNDNPMLLLLKYACVLEAPGHGPTADPAFTLEILDENGRQTDPVCGMANFTGDLSNIQADPTWHIEEFTVEGNKALDPVVWKDWTTIGMNISEYAGRTIRVRLTTKDCAQVAHYGYAYFTLSCNELRQTAVSCGDMPIVEATAPVGFDYEWYRADDPYKTVVCTDRKLNVPADEAATYTCDVISKVNPDCRFEMDVDLLPRNPKSDFIMKWAPTDCRNRIILTNTSYLQTEAGSTGQRPETIQWFVDGVKKSKDWDYTMDIPDEGGTYNVQLVTGVAGDRCTDTLNSVVEVPSIEIEDTVRLPLVQICPGQVHRYGGQAYRAGTHYIAEKSEAGCEYIVELKVEEADPITVSIDSVVCDGDIVTWTVAGVDQNLSKTGVYQKTDKSTGGCDSVTTLHLTVLEKLEVLSENVVVCADDSVVSIPYRVTSGQFTYCNVSFDGYGLSQGFVDTDTVTVDSTAFGEGVITFALPDSVRPDRYEVSLFFSDSHCGNDSVTMELYVKYASSVIEQKFNDVLALLSSAYNGGYTFDSYQWYCNGAIIPNATGSYLYVGPESMLDFNAKYHVSLVRVGESYAVETCAPDTNLLSVRTDKTIYIQQSVSPAGSPLYVGAVRSNAMAQWWTIGGVLVREEEVYVPGDYITTPGVPGIYLLRLVSNNEISTFKVVVR